MDYIRVVKNSGLKVIDVIQHFGLMGDPVLKMEQKGEQLQGNCPFKLHSGNRDSLGFGVHISKDVYNCATHCGRGQGVIDFWCDMHGIDRTNGRSALFAARSIYSTFLKNDTIQEIQSKRPCYSQTTIDYQIKAVEKTNPVKNIKLSLDYNPVALLQKKNLTAETLKVFDSGVATMGSLTGRFAVAVHNKDGKIIGYAGQDLDKGDWYFFFNKSLELYNYHRVKKIENLDFVIIVESFYSVMYLTQLGFTNVVSGFGRYLSETQLQRISELSENVLLFFDNDDSGKKAVENFSKNYKGDLNVSIFDYKNEAALKPYQFSIEELELKLKL